LIDIKRARRKIQQIICVVQYDICYYVAWRAGNVSGKERCASWRGNTKPNL
jgi:hypothetical protein